MKGELLYKNEGKQPKELTLTFDKAGKENSNVSVGSSNSSREIITNSTLKLTRIITWVRLE
ncbi:hypothetical protein EEL32_09020 [Brevibacillus laterosporus]|nr:hypothetical protein EEL31_01900 [Brevibacillus laterosporus]TPG88297.1 hypothetical protein EEL32_09020 [Brevibacillus laterosporus]